MLLVYLCFLKQVVLALPDLYGVNVRPVAPFGSLSSKPFVDTALLHRCLPDELLFEVRLCYEVDPSLLSDGES